MKKYLPMFAAPCKYCGFQFLAEPRLRIVGGLVDASFSEMATVEATKDGIVYTCQSCDEEKMKVIAEKKRA